ncbi:MAG: hypothetical protein KA236_01445 [Verrucomicrobia bacterium]|jgi:hypothetical protein|nr:hypothetical protein [Verrucomicrobiota bacterium]
MSERFDFVSTTDKPALLAFSTPDWLEMARTALVELGYKVHTAATHSDFLVRFSQVRYQVVIVEELFAANTLEENSTLQALKEMPMSQRRHATVILLGDSFQTFMPMQAFQHSIHAVVNTAELFLLRQLIEKAVADKELFLSSYQQAQARLLAAGRSGREES